MVQKSERLSKSEVGTVVPTSDGTHPRPTNSAKLKKLTKLTKSEKPLKPTKSVVRSLWLVIWITLFLINVILGLAAPDSDLLTFFRIGGIVLCLLYVAITFPCDRLLLAAMFTTCTSDIILAFNNTSEIGLVTFLATQIIHLFRLTNTHYHYHAIAFASFASVLIILNLAFSLIPLLFLIAGLYATTLILNILASFRWRKNDPSNPHSFYAAAGFTLFACCDFCTGLSYLSLIAVLPVFFYAPANFLAWFFYYPSQVLVSCSSKLHISPTKFAPSSRKYAIINPKEGKC